MIGFRLAGLFGVTVGVLGLLKIAWAARSGHPIYIRGAENSPFMASIFAWGVICLGSLFLLAKKPKQ